MRIQVANRLERAQLLDTFVLLSVRGLVLSWQGYAQA